MYYIEKGIFEQSLVCRPAPSDPEKSSFTLCAKENKAHPKPCFVSKQHLIAVVLPHCISNLQSQLWQTVHKKHIKISNNIFSK